MEEFFDGLRNDGFFEPFFLFGAFVTLAFSVLSAGAFIIAIIEIIQKFKLSKKFGKGVLFGFGLLFLQPIFESIIAFSKKIKYKG